MGPYNDNLGNLRCLLYIYCYILKFQAYKSCSRFKINYMTNNAIKTILFIIKLYILILLLVMSSILWWTQLPLKLKSRSYDWSGWQTSWRVEILIRWPGSLSHPRGPGFPVGWRVQKVMRSAHGAHWRMHSIK